MHSVSSFLFSALSIVVIDLLLGGDNAIVIAMAVQSLPARRRRLGISIGAAGAVLLRIVLTFFAARLLDLPYIRLVGGVLILWIGAQLLGGTGDDAHHLKSPRGLGHAVWMILLADVTMSLDNILAVAAASKGNLLLLSLGLGLSITFLVFASDLLSRLMDRYPVIVWLGAAILGRVGGEMFVADTWLVARYHPAPGVDLVAQAAGASLVVVAGWFLREKAGRKERSGASNS
jgi:YjbE family integral membrane protein